MGMGWIPQILPFAMHLITTWYFRKFKRKGYVKLESKKKMNILQWNQAPLYLKEDEY